MSAKQMGYSHVSCRLLVPSNILPKVCESVRVLDDDRINPCWVQQMSQHCGCDDDVIFLQMASYIGGLFLLGEEQ